MINPLDVAKAAKEIGDLVRKYNDVPLYEKIVDLQGQLVEIATERMTLFTENQELRHQLSVRSKITFKEPFYFQEGDEVPLCATCYETSKRELVVHLAKPEKFNSEIVRQCRTCRSIYSLGPAPATDREPFESVGGPESWMR